MDLQQKVVYDKFDIMNLLGCGEAKAQSIIRSVKYCTGDKTKLKGKILVTEFEAWVNAVNIKI